MIDDLWQPKREQAAKFFEWWKGDKDRALCTLEQAIGAYCSTFPGRIHILLVELLEHVRERRTER